MRKKIIIIQIFAAALLLSTLVMVNLVSAANFIKPGAKTNIDNYAKSLSETAGYEAADKDSALYLIQTAINIFLSVIGVLLLVYILYAGYNWLTAQGEEEKVERAKDTLKRAVIGVIIIIAAYAISWFVMTRIESKTLKTSGSGSGYAFNLPPSKILAAGVKN